MTEGLAKLGDRRLAATGQACAPVVKERSDKLRKRAGRRGKDDPNENYKPTLSTATMTSLETLLIHDRNKRKGETQVQESALGLRPGKQAHDFHLGFRRGTYSHLGLRPGTHSQPPLSGVEREGA